MNSTDTKKQNECLKKLRQFIDDKINNLNTEDIRKRNLCVEVYENGNWVSLEESSLEKPNENVNETINEK